MNVIGLRVFPLSLTGDAAVWFTELTYNSIYTWDQLTDVFLEKYFPMSKKLNHKDKINNFIALPGEPVSSSWDRFTAFIRGVPNHHIDDESLKEYFYRGQDDNSKAVWGVFEPIPKVPIWIIGAKVKEIKKTMKRFDSTDENVKEMRNDLSGIGQKVDAHAVSIKHLEQQMTQLSTIHTIDPRMPSRVEVEASKNDDVIEVNEEPKNATEKEAEITQKVVPMPRPPPHFLQRLVNKTEEGKYHMFISMLKQLSIDLPLIEALEQMPRYAKFMKGLVTKKRAVSFEDDDKLKH
ncbi:hypothetical protein R3W88_033538 [Solanum pinnatisectum]|uniref:Retrotransposon gag domain-containing protein n=1 Tax=Solanum pinnatisectum TaxID=50273 RepID=A0AAV9K2S7_9SOLN|nr:hypothetical protein R3W88_033538 [Solanum pinnatisectum]